MLMEISVWIVPFLFLFYILYDDFKRKKISNVVLLYFLVYIILVNIFQFYFSVISKADIVLNIIDFIISLFIAFLLWDQKMWAAGDAKLFAVIVLMLPISFYKVKYFGYFYSFGLLCNIFICAFVMIVFIQSFYLIRNNNIGVFFREVIIKHKKWFSGFKFQPLFQNFFLIFQLTLIRFFFDLPDGLYIIFVFLFWSKLTERIPRNIFFSYPSLTFFLCLEIWLFQTIVFQIPFIYLLVLFILLRILRNILDFVFLSLHRITAKRITIKDVRPDQIFLKTQSFSFNKLVNKPISKNQSKWIKKHVKPEATLLLDTTFPFVFYIIVGLIVTIVLRGRILWDFVHI